MFDRAEEQLAALLKGTIEQLDIPRELHRAAVAQYQHVAEYLGAAGEFDENDIAIYPQGSFRLGTVVLPIGRSDYDIDLVFRLALPKETITQRTLKGIAGRLLAEFVQDCVAERPSLTEGGRCWTLGWPRFHMDVLPSVPNPENAPFGILLTDRDLRLWQWSNPIDFANWVYAQMEKQLLAGREALAKARGVSIEQVQGGGKDDPAGDGAGAEEAPRPLLRSHPAPAAAIDTAHHAGSPGIPRRDESVRGGRQRGACHASLR